jgi:hypothetical protein
MKTTARKKALNKVLTQARNELSEIESAERAAENAKLVGRFFKYRNNYSCPEKESDYWYLYTAVERTDADGGIRQFSFQTDKNGDIRIEPDQWHIGLLSGYAEIPFQEFDIAWQKVVRLVNRVEWA